MIRGVRFDLRGKGILEVRQTNLLDSFGFKGHISSTQINY